MLLILVAVIATAAAFALYMLVEKQGTGGVPLALLRAVAWGVVAALLLNPALRRLAPAGTTVLLDGSLSMSDASGDARWRAAVDTATGIGDRGSGIGNGGRIIVFGDVPRPWSDSVRPTAISSRLLPALREAAARGGQVVVVTDGVIDDVGALPPDLLRAARIVVLPRPSAPDAGVASFDLPPALRAGDTARVLVDIAVQGGGPRDSVTVELVERDRVVARTRVAAGAGGLLRRELAFVPAMPPADREVRTYEVRLSGFAPDTDPRDDRRASAAVVTRAAAVAVFSDSPDWDFRALAASLAATSGVPVRVYVRPSSGGQWRDARTLRSVTDAEIRTEASQATLVVAHGSEASVNALANASRRALLRWPTSRSSPGDWYVVAPEFSSPVGGALGGVAAESLPPLESVTELVVDSVEWTGLVAQMDRRGRSRPVLQGVVRGGRRSVLVPASGFWRWASRGGAAAEAYRALVASLADWLLEEQAAAPAQLLALRDSLARGANELVPREPVLKSQAGVATASAGEPVPLRHTGWLYFAALGALVTEWVVRRRRGLR